jgi:hypothetical protein
LTRPVAIAAAAAVAACTAARIPAPDAGFGPGALQLAGQFSIPPLTRLPPVVGLQFGGISGLAPANLPGEYVAVCDERLGSRVYRMRLSGEGAAFRAEALATIPLEVGGRAPSVDPEAIAVAAGGDMWIASEGLATGPPRVPSVIARYTSSGAFVRQIELRERFLPNPEGPITRGLRGNAGLESLTITPGGRLFAATETALAQDADPASFERGTLARLLEFTADGDGFEPAREFVYPLDRIETVPYEAGAIVKGVVELLALGETEMLALERTYVEEAKSRGQGTNRAQLYRVSIEGATDVSSVDSLKDATEAVPVRKTLVLDLSAVPGLDGDLAPSLDNFEGLAFGPRLADGRQSLVLVSDDNFHEHQRTWFLLFGIGRP